MLKKVRHSLIGSKHVPDAVKLPAKQNSSGDPKNPGSQLPEQNEYD